MTVEFSSQIILNTSDEQQLKSLAYLVFLKFKNDEVPIKARGFTDGTNQQNLLSKEDTSSPTFSSEASYCYTLLMKWKAKV